MIEDGKAAGKAGRGRGSRLSGGTPWLVAWLAATLPLAVLGALAPEAPGAGAIWVTVHLFLLWAAFQLQRRGDAVAATGWRGVTADVLHGWLLLALLPLLYAELPLLMAGLPGPVTYHDGLVRSVETGLFGGEPAFRWAGSMPHVLVSETLHLGYLLYYPLIYLPPLLLWFGWSGPSEAGDRREAFHRTAAAIAVAMLGAYAVIVVFPVQGPRYLGVPEGVPSGFFRSVALALLETGSSRGAAFPSSHVSVAVAQAWVAIRVQPRVGRPTAVIALLLSLGAVYGGFHYAVDVLAGAALGALAGVVALRGWERG